jgi:hypothetical protein
MASVEDLLDRLSRPGAATVPAAELRAALGVSPATLSRLVAAAGDRVARLGQTRAVVYARTRVVEGLGRRVPVYRVAEDGSAGEVGELRFLWERSTWLTDSGPGGGWRVGLPPFVADMAPQGYLGQAFPARYPELRLPPRLSVWSDDDRLRVLALRGEDSTGNVIIGSESLERFFALSPSDAAPDAFPDLAEQSARGAAGSSAGGERPKFGAVSGGRHVLVKFAPPGSGPVDRRWRDLLWCEAHALRVIANAGQEAAEAVVHDVRGWRFLETVRFDRVGIRGRRSVLSLEALANEYLSDRVSWTVAAAELAGPGARDCPYTLAAAEAARLRWLDAFGQLTGNTDRHFGNVTFFVSEDRELRVAPAYDTLPMVLAPAAGTLVERPFRAEPPAPGALEEWKAAAPWAVRYWHDLAAQPRLDASVRQQAQMAGRAVEGLARKVMPAEWDRSLRMTQGRALSR